MAKEIFGDNKLQFDFERDGYVTIPFLKKEEIDFLTEQFWKYFPEVKEPHFGSSTYSADFQFKKEVSDIITSVYDPHCKSYFKDYRKLGSAYLYKPPGPQSEMLMHQDWTVVDESKFSSVNIWVPLEDINAENGALWVLPGSHSRFISTLRAPTLPFYFTGHESKIKERLKPIHVPAGTAVVLNQSTIHYSPANKTDHVRIAMSSGLVSDGAQMLFHYKNLESDSNELELFEQTDDFFICFEDFHKDIFQRPKFGKSLHKFNYDVPQFTGDEMDTLLDQMEEKRGTFA